MDLSMLAYWKNQAAAARRAGVANSQSGCGALKMLQVQVDSRAAGAARA